MGLAYFVVVGAIAWVWAPGIFRILGHDAAVAGMEVTYFRIMIYTHAVAISIWSSSQFFIGIHRPIVTMYAALCGQVVNICANYVLIFGKFGFPAMGIAGAGWGTFIGVSVEAVILIAMFLSGDINAAFKCRRSLNIDFGKMGDLLKVGFPAGLGFMINIAFFGMILFGLVGKFGREALAATSAVFACINLSVMPIVGIGTALTAAVGKSIGRGRKDVAIKQTSVCFRATTIYMVLMGFCFFVFRDAIMQFWSSDDKVIEAGVNILICAGIFQVFNSMTMTYTGSLRGAGDTVWLAVVSASGSVLILGLGGFFMTKFFPETGVLGPWIAATINVMAVAAANHWRFKSNSWMRIDLFKRQVPSVPVDIGTVIE